MGPTTQAPEKPQEVFIQEIALFLSVHLGRSPGLLWPEHEPSAPYNAESALPAALAHHLGRDVTVLTDPTGDPHRPHAAPTAQDVLAYQLDGADTWHITPPAGSPLTLRLRTGEMLYAPAGSHITTHPLPGSRTLLLALGPAL